MRLAAALLATVAFAQPSGWEVLFDGTSASHWTGGIGKPFPSNGWSIKDGCLYTDGTLNAPSLFSQSAYRNFELEFEWKINPGGNTGVKYLGVPGRIHPDFWQGLWTSSAMILGMAGLVAVIGLWRRRNLWLRRAAIAGVIVLLGVEAWAVSVYWETYRSAPSFPVGLEYQIIDNEPNDAGVVIGAGRTAALYDLLPAPEAKPLPPGQFNSSRIVVNGATVEHWLNGKPVLRYQLGSPELLAAVANSKFKGVPGYGQPASGYIELQNHQTPAWFRNIRIRQLEP